MPSPQVQQWLDDGSKLREDIFAVMEQLEQQRQDLERQLNDKRVELDLLAHILDRADEKPSKEHDAGPNFNAKAGSGSSKGGNKDEWHPGM